MADFDCGDHVDSTYRQVGHYSAAVAELSKAINVAMGSGDQTMQHFATQQLTKIHGLMVEVEAAMANVTENVENMTYEIEQLHARVARAPVMTPDTEVLSETTEIFMDPDEDTEVVTYEPHVEQGAQGAEGITVHQAEQGGDVPLWSNQPDDVWVPPPPPPMEVPSGVQAPIPQVPPPQRVVPLVKGFDARGTPIKAPPPNPPQPPRVDPPVPAMVPPWHPPVPAAAPVQAHADTPQGGQVPSFGPGDLVNMIPGNREHAVTRDWQGGCDTCEGFKFVLKDIPCWMGPSQLLPMATTDFKKVKVSWFRVSMHQQPRCPYFRLAVFTFRDMNDALMAWSVLQPWQWFHYYQGITSPQGLGPEDGYNSRLSWFEPWEAVYFSLPGF